MLRWWYGEVAPERRALPWRTTRDPWAVLVSETMLQQTQVARVVEPFGRFLGRFPGPPDCAAAPAGDVLRLWSGLGYNRRALNLHRAAGRMVELHGGRVPTGLAELLALPGVGPYTARAVLAFAAGEPVGVLDTNVARVLARSVAGRPLRPQEAQRLADALVPAAEGWAWNQALMDVGALVCTSRAPLCGECPLRRVCRWAAGGHAGVDPALGSAGVGGRQSRFEGSDRQGRGRLVAALRAGSVETVALPEVTGWPDDPDRAHRVAAGLVAEGLAVHLDGGRLALP